MVEILQKAIPDDMRQARGLPGVQPLAEPWLRVDDAYATQMAHRRALIADRRAEVYWQDAEAEAAAAEVLAEALGLLPGLGFEVAGRECRCPDGLVVDLEADAPLVVLGHLVQEDICLMAKRGSEHVLVAACLCFPASWRLSEKVGRPLVGIHAPVEEYDEGVARRVQRLFDGVQVGRPLWRFNRLWYDDPELFQPRSAMAPRRIASGAAEAPYQRAERQCITRMPQSGAVVFSIHTYVVRLGRP
ncbi:heme-dependent oxidative N-demethylase family protein [Roseobacter sp. A03A-229]